MSIEIKNLSCVYGVRTPYEKKALDNISFTVNEGESVGLIGMTGSGKSTLLQHLNGLIKLKSGSVKVFDIDLTKRRPDLMKLRKHVGMLFQYPEYQLFADTVKDDIMFGPLNFGMKKPEAEQAAARAAELTGLNWEEIKDRSPLELSGGQKRRVAIAGILAYSPDILVLDEPTAGLDPLGKKEMLDLIASLRKTTVSTVITVSHNMDEIAEYCDRVIVLSDGKLLYDTTPAKLFYEEDLTPLHLQPPHTVRIVRLLEEKGIKLSRDILTEDQLVSAVKDYFSGGEHA